MTVEELGNRMSSRELSEWKIYYELEPFGEERADLRQALTTSAVYNSIQAQTKHPKWTKPEDFMPFNGETKEEPREPGEAVSPDELKAKLRAFTGKRKG